MFVDLRKKIVAINKVEIVLKKTIKESFKKQFAKYKFSLRFLKTIYKFSILIFANTNNYICYIWKIIYKYNTIVNCEYVVNILIKQQSI